MLDSNDKSPVICSSVSVLCDEEGWDAGRQVTLKTELKPDKLPEEMQMQEPLPITLPHLGLPHWKPAPPI